jgi:type I restriction enzyme S subunit
MAESQTNISQEIVKKVLTVIPSDQEQIAIANLLDENLQSYQEHLLIKNKLYLIKTGLMQDLLTGKVRVTNLLKEREPTSP